MKKILTLLLFVVVAVTTNAQTPPEAFNYSAVARDQSGLPITNSTIGIQISIKISSPLGATVYQENHFVNTDDFGLFNLIVGGGSILSGAIADIDWSLDNYYLQVGMDVNGGTSFVNMGSTQLLSVPYALYAKTAGSVNGNMGFSGDYNDLINTPFFSAVATSGDYLDLSNTPNNLSYFNNDVGYITQSGLANVATSGNYNDLINTPNLSAVATSGNYNDLINTPTNVSVFNNDSGYLTYANLDTVATTGDYNDLSNQPITVSSISIDGDTLFLSNGETFVNTNSNGLLPTVTTTAATSISANYAYTGGEVTNSGGEYVLARGVCYSTTPNPTIDDQVKSGGSGLGSFTNYISSLSMGTTYYVRAFATNANGTAYGNEITFTTTTVALVDSLACVSGTLNGTLNAGVVASGVTLTVDYFGGNGGNYSGVSINSTGVTGLTATLTSGQLVNGDGSVVLQISGTPSSTGTAVFVLNLGFGYCVFSTTAICQDGLCYGQSYQGGIIGYLLTPSDSGYDPNTPHGIIVAPTDQSTGAEWGCYGSSVGASGSGFGTGSQNTIDIETGCSTSGTAADICANLTLGGYNDWFLPSIDELEMLFANAANYQGSFGNGYYWSSTEFDLNNAFRFYPTGTWSSNRPKSDSYYVRAVRYF